METAPVGSNPGNLCGSPTPRPLGLSRHPILSLGAAGIRRVEVCRFTQIGPFVCYSRFMPHAGLSFRGVTSLKFHHAFVLSRTELRIPRILTELHQRRLHINIEGNPCFILRQSTRSHSVFEIGLFCACLYQNVWYCGVTSCGSWWTITSDVWSYCIDMWRCHLKVCSVSEQINAVYILMGFPN